MVFIANPNNPTGSYLAADDLARLHAGLPGDVLLVIDAAYAEYVGRNDYLAGAELVDRADNVVMTRTFSKIHGLGGLRVGWGYGPAHAIDVLNRVRGPFNLSTAALAAAEAAIRDTGWAARCRVENARNRAALAAALAAVGVPSDPSEANFLLARFDNAEAAYRNLLAAGVVVRDMRATQGLGDALRITVGQPEENDAVFAALAPVPQASAEAAA